MQAQCKIKEIKVAQDKDSKFLDQIFGLSGEKKSDLKNLFRFEICDINLVSQAKNDLHKPLCNSAELLTA